MLVAQSLNPIILPQFARLPANLAGMEGLLYGTEAIDVFTTISHAERKPPEYFVNFSLALLQAQHNPEAEAVAREGLELYPNDFDALGNLTIALRCQGKCADALEVLKWLKRG
jgi:Flp pilus assembly protein TadD